MGNVPEFDADELALQGWINREGIIPPSGQQELRESVGRVLDKLSVVRQELKDARLAHDLLLKENERCLARTIHLEGLHDAMLEQSYATKMVLDNEKRKFREFRTIIRMALESSEKESHETS
jgi:hypothetical protein